MKALIFSLFLFFIANSAQAKQCQDFVWRITAVLDDNRCTEPIVEGRFSVKICEEDLSYMLNDHDEKTYLFRNGEDFESRSDIIDMDRNLVFSTILLYDLEAEEIEITKEKYDLSKGKLIDSYQCKADLQIL